MMISAPKPDTGINVDAATLNGDLSRIYLVRIAVQIGKFLAQFAHAISSEKFVDSFFEPPGGGPHFSVLRWRSQF